MGGGKTFESAALRAINTFDDNLGENSLKDKMRKLFKAYILDDFKPDEYYLLGYEKLSSPKRRSMLTDKRKDELLLKYSGADKFDELSDKYTFYKKNAKYFNRKVMYLDHTISENDFVKFSIEVKNLFIKPIVSTFGEGIKSVIIENETDAHTLYNTLTSVNESRWIVEERLNQCAELAAFNSSSLNTVRVPAFLTQKGFYILTPFFRTGRNGAIVDNAGSGGVFANVDYKTGIIETDGIDEFGNIYKQHPDSQIFYKNFQIPQWLDLIKLVEKIHRECMPNHIYIGWDFALTDKGWTLIEGNWGQFVNQYIDKKGRKHYFEKYLKEGSVKS